MAPFDPLPSVKGYTPARTVRGAETERRRSNGRCWIMAAVRGGGDGAGVLPLLDYFLFSSSGFIYLFMAIRLLKLLDDDVAT